MATFTSLNFIKYYVLNFLDERTLNSFIDIGYFVVSGVFQMYVIYFIAFDKQLDPRTCQIWDDYEAAAGLRSVEKLKPKYELLPTLNGIVTIGIVVLKTMSWSQSFEGVISKHSTDTVDGLFLWTPDDFDNRASIIEYHLADHNSTSFYIMGFFGFISVFCWNLLAECFKDLIFWVAKVHEHRITVFGDKVKENVTMKVISAKGGVLPDNIDDDHCWKMYRDLVAVNTLTNKTYNILFVLNHLDTFLTFSYFLTLILKKDSSMIELIFTGYEVFKGVIAYFPARRASLQVSLEFY